MKKEKAPKKVKVAGIKAPKTPKAPKKVETKGEFKLVVRLNDEVFETETDNLQESIQSFAPEFLRTKVIIEVTKDEKTVERVLYLQKGKILFTNRIALESLVKNLIF